MPQFEINYAQGVPSVVSMPRANMNVDTGAGILADATSRMGGALFEVGQKIQKAEEVSEFNSFEVAATRRMNEHYQSLMNNQDPDSYEKSRQQAIQDIQGFAGGLKNRSASELAVNYASKIDVDSQYRTFSQANETKVKNMLASNEVNEDFWANQAISGTDAEHKAALQKIGSSYKGLVDTGVVNKDVASAKMQLIAQKVNVKRAEFLNKQAVDSTFTAAISSIGTDWNKDKAYEIIKNSGLSTDDVVTLGNRIDGYVSGQKKTTADNKYAKELTATTDFVKAIQSNSVNANIIEQAYPSNTGQSLIEKQKYYAILQGVNDIVTPQKFTPDGGSSARQTVLDSATGKISTKAAYDDLMKARYVDRVIDDNTYQWAVQHIEKPYPQHMIGDIKSQLIANRKKISASSSYFNPFQYGESGAEASKSNYVNQELMKWVDAQIEQKKTPSAKELFIRSQELMNSDISHETSSQVEVQPESVKPKDYPDAVWNPKHKMWTITKDGRLMGVK
jgi:hypothetical protein